MTGRTVLCDHFVFGSAPAAGGSGGGRHRYGIVARSAGVDERILSMLDGYLHPAGVDPAGFVRSSSLLVLGGTVAFTQARNAGYDGEGRPNSIYSHTTLIAERDFAAIGNDTRVLAMQTPHVGGAGDLGPLEVRPLGLGIDLASAKRLGLAHLRPFLEAALSGGRVAVRRASDPDLLPGLLSLLPAQLRLRPFSTLLADPSRQPSFEIVQTDAPPSSLGRYRVVDPAGPRPRPRASPSLLGRCAGHVARLVLEGDGAAVARLHEEFDAVPELPRRDRVCLAAGAQMYDAGLHRSEADAERLARMLVQLPLGRAAAYFNRLGRFMADGDRLRHAQRYGARLLTVQYEDRALDAAAFEEMLDRCGGGEGVGGPRAGARGLVRDLLDQRPADLRSAGSAILAAVALRPDAREVVEEFAAAAGLRPAILGALSGPPDMGAGRRERLFLLAARPLLAAGPRHFADLLAAGARDLATDEGVGLFRGAVSALLSGPADGGEDLDSLAGAAEALHDRASGQFSREGGAREGPRHARLRSALADVCDALAGADERARRGGAPADGPARQRAALAIKKIESLIGAAPGAQGAAPLSFSASEVLPFWQWWRFPTLKSGSAAKK